MLESGSLSMPCTLALQTASFLSSLWFLDAVQWWTEIFISLIFHSVEFCVQTAEETCFKKDLTERPQPQIVNQSAHPFKTSMLILLIPTDVPPFICALFSTRTTAAHGYVSQLQQKFQASRNMIQFYFTLHTFCFMRYVRCKHMQNLTWGSSVK